MKLEVSQTNLKITPKLFETTSDLTFTKTEVVCALREYAYRTNGFACSPDFDYEIFLLDDTDGRTKPGDAVLIRTCIPGHNDGAIRKLGDER